MADGPTFTTWEGYAKPSTENVGRIWTDKTVWTDDVTLTGGTQDGIKVSKDANADFLVGLSALSSTSNLTSATSKPLDIVLVLDTSGSMGYGMDGSESLGYSAVYDDDLDTSKTYYNQNGRREYTYDVERAEWGYFDRGRWQNVTPKSNSSDRANTQFYEKEVSRLEALQSAVSSFIDATATANQEISDVDRQHRIGIVRYSSDASTASDLVSVSGSNVQNLKNAVDRLNADGGTHPDKGFDEASRVLRSAREGVQQVVIFFTDGQPGDYAFDGKIAASVINNARTMKQNGAIIYSVGVVEGADPSDTGDKLNAYLNGVSSNYPEASATGTSEGSFLWPTDGTLNVNLGTRAEDGDYYKATTDADELNTIFQDIFEGIKIPGSSPTAVEEGFAGAGGYITFTDTLGDYMTVKGDTMTVVFADESFTGTRQPDGAFAFEGAVEGNPVYGNAQLSDLKVTVAPGTDGKGDTVEVKIPASLIPLRNYVLDTDMGGNTTMQTNPAYPIRVFYSVGLQDGVQEKVANPDATMQQYIKENSADGAVAFYSNDFDKGSKTGKTIAAFTPASTNKFYFFTEDTPLYTDEACGQRASRNDIQGDGNLYYKNDYYVEENGKGVAQQGHIAIPKSALQTGGVREDNYGSDSEGGIFIKAGVQRLNRTNDFTGTKGDGNLTGTATDFIAPGWVGRDINIALGNNGKKSVGIPATLAVSKQVEAAAGFEAGLDGYRNTEFDFTIAVDGATGPYNAVVKNAAGEVQGEAFTLNFTNGTCTHSLKHGETLYIYGLPADAAYTVTEAPVAGFTAASDNAEGTLISGQTSEAKFTNTYKAEGATLAADTVSVQKILEGREWRDSDAFTFGIGGSNAPDFQNKEVAIASDTPDHKANFGTVTFDKPGTYTYTIWENDPEPTSDDPNKHPIPGINYSNAWYEVSVAVVDNPATGKLEIRSTAMTQTRDDANAELDPAVEVGDKTAVFTNVYNVKDAVASIFASKSYTDTSGGKAIADGMFSVQLEAQGGYKTADGSLDDLTIDKASVPMPADAQGTTDIEANEDAEFRFDNINFDGDDVGNTYVYKLTEVKGDVEGMTYDSAEYIVQIAVVEVPAQGEDPATIKTEVTTVGQSGAPTFVNTYDPDDAVLSGDTAIGGTKIMTGRDMLEGEEFTFALKPTGATLAAINDGTSGISGIGVDGLTATASDGAMGEVVPFSFGDIAFSKAGTYAFSMTETAGNAGGVKYDTTPRTVTVEVTLDEATGALKAAVTYDANNTFTNDYASKVDFGAAGGVKVDKVLNGRPAAAGEFTFTVEAEASDTATAEEAAAKLAEDEASFGNAAAGVNQQATAKTLFSGVTFTQADAGKTYAYTVKESQPAQGEGLPAVTYDESVYTMELAVVDNNDGTMKVVTTVKNASDDVVSTADTSAEGYVVPTILFTNTYAPGEATLEGEGAMHVTKKVSGAPIEQAFAFTATLTGGAVDGVTGLDENHAITAATADSSFADGGTSDATFAGLTFTKMGTYTFEVTENAPTAKDGWTWSAEKKTITVNVTDKQDGVYLDTLVATVTSGNGSVFTNSYKAEPAKLGGDAEQKITVNKTVQGYSTDADFTFVMTPDTTGDTDWSGVTYNGEAVSGATIEAAVTDAFADGDTKAATFGEFSFDKVGIYTFNVVEKEAASEAPAGWTYDDSTQQITVTVTDEGNDGFLDAVVSEAPMFTNTYKPSSVTTSEDTDTTLKAKKTVEGRPWLMGESFEFTLAAQDGAPTPGAGSETATATEAAPEASFGNITFDAAGTYKYTITEVKGANTALAYDEHTATVTVEVIDNGEGALEIQSVTYDNTGANGNDTSETGIAAFTNIYTSTPTSYGGAGAMLGGNKFVDNQSGSFEMTDDMFTFTMRAQATGNPMPEGLTVTQDGQGRNIVTVNNSQTTNNQSVYDFGTIEFTHDDVMAANPTREGNTLTATFQYNIFENDTDEPGVTIDNSSYTVTFTVTENLETGAMDVTTSAVKIVGGSGDNQQADMSALDFTNIYNVGEISGWQNIFKTLDGRNFQSGDKFVFNVSMTAVDEDGQPMAKEQLPAVTQQANEEGNHTSSLSEINYTDSGFNYTATIEPSKTATGNTYRTDTGKITYTHTGTYTYTVSEAAEPKIGGVTNDETEYTVVVKITAVGEALQRTVTVTPETAVKGTLDFTNTYVPEQNEGVDWTSAQLTKVFTGKNWDGEEFEFTISSVTEGAPMPASGNTVKVSGPDEEGGNTATFNFGDITFNEAGTYVYEVTETKGDLGGVTYSTNKATVTVTVTDKDASGAATGKLVATATVENGTFTNTYQSKLDYVDAGGLQLTKTLNGRDMADGQFEFTVKSTGDEDRLGIDGKTFESPAAKAGVESAPVKLISGETVEFTSDDAGKKFSYEIVETKKGEAGYTNDEATHKVDIEVTDNGDGTLKVTTTVDGAPYEYATDGAAAQVPTVKFVNSYDAGTATLGGEGEVSINATKSLTNRPMTDGEFTFEVKNADTVVATGTNDANGVIAFEEISYDLDTLRADAESGVAQKVSADGVDTYTYHYTVAEKTDGLDAAGVTPVASSFEIEVVVTDDNTGKLKVEVVYPEGTTSLGFENTYGTGASGEFHAQGKKVLNAADGLTPPDIANKFTFTISGVDENGNEAPLPEKTEATNDAAGNVDFGKIEFTMQNVYGDTGSVAADADGEGGVQTMSAQRTKTFTYTVAESGDVAGVTNDPEASKTFEVAVTDNGDGTISVSGPTSAAFTFVNTYAVESVTFDPTGEGALSIGKTLTGRDMSEGEFSFELVETVDGAEAVVSTGTAAAAADGEAAAASFAPITYTEPGEHTYTLREVKGEAGGVDYDSREYTVKASVVDNGDGTLSVKMGFDGAEAATFENAYAADPTSVSLQAAKVLEGADLADGQFTFQMLDREGKVFREARNDAEGAVAFPAIEFTEAGTYTYAVVEKNDGQEGVTYDDARYEVVVTVADDGEGNLAAAVESNAGEEGLVFENAYAAPADPEPAPLPPADDGDGATLVKTGDAAPTAPLVGGALAAAAALALAGRKLVRVPLRRDR